MKNAFDELGISPLATVDEITAELRDRAEDAGEEERSVLRAAWEELTMHPRSRLALALTTFPASNDRAPRPPPPPESAPPSLDAPSLVDLLPRPSVEAALASPRVAPTSVLPSIAEDRLAFGDGADPKRRNQP